MADAVGKRTTIVRDGLRHKKRTQTLSRGGYVPRYSGLVAEAGGKKTAFRHVRRRYEIARRGEKTVFYIKITRDDGVVIEEDEWGGTNVLWCRSASGWDFQPENLTYEDGYWSFKIPESKIDENGYWISIRYIEHSVWTVYPYRYRDADMYQESDLIKPDTYEAAVPYWIVTHMNDQLEEMECDEDGYLTPNFISSVAQKTFQAEPGHPIYKFIFFDGGGIYTEKINVKSSIPYQLHRWTFDSGNNIRTKRAREVWHSHDWTKHSIMKCLDVATMTWIWTTVEYCCYPCLHGPYSGCIFPPDRGGPFSLKNGNINLTITDDPIPELHDRVELEGSIEGRNHKCTLSGGGTEEDNETPPPICQEGIWIDFTYSHCRYDFCINDGGTPYESIQWYPGVYDCMGISVRYDHY